MFSRKKRKLGELIAIYKKLLEIEWNLDNINSIQNHNFQFEKISKEFDNSEKFSIVAMNNIINLKRLNPTYENIIKAKKQTLASLSKILIEQNQSHRYKFEIVAFSNPDKFDFNMKDEILRYLRLNFKSFRSRYSDSTYRAKLIFENSIHKNALIVQRKDLIDINIEIELIDETSELISIIENKESDFKQAEKLLIL